MRIEALEKQAYQVHAPVHEVTIDKENDPKESNKEIGEISEA